MVVRALTICFGVAAVVSAQVPGARQSRDLASWLPARTALLVEADDLRASLNALRAFVGKLPPWLELADAGANAALRFTLGVDLDGLLAVLAPGPAALALVVPAAGKPWWIFLSRVRDADVAQDLAARVPGVAIDVRNGLCAVGAHAEVLRAWREAPRLAPAALRRGQSTLPRGGLRVFLDLAALRARRDRALWDDLDPGARVLLGPGAAALDAGTRLDAVFEVSADALVLEGSVDASVLACTPQRELLACGAAPRPRMRVPTDTLLVAELDRSLRGYLTHLDDLLPPAVAARVRGEAANLDVLIGTGSFVGDVLAGVLEPLQLIIVGAPLPAPDDDAKPRPRLDLPGFALVGRVATERARSLLTRGFYRLSAVLSGQRAQRGLAPKIAQRCDVGEHRLHIMRGPAFAGVGDPPTDEQIEATLVFAAGYGVLATTPHCAQQVLAALAAPGEHDTRVGDAVTLFGAPIADYIARNRAAVVAARVLDEGESVAQAQRFVQGLLDVARMLGAIDLEVIPDVQATAWRLRVQRGTR
jgi:hypothetical protein